MRSTACTSPANVVRVSGAAIVAMPPVGSGCMTFVRIEPSGHAPKTSRTAASFGGPDGRTARVAAGDLDGGCSCEAMVGVRQNAYLVGLCLGGSWTQARRLNAGNVLAFQISVLGRKIEKNFLSGREAQWTGWKQ